MGDRCSYVQIRFPGNRIEDVAEIFELPYDTGGGDSDLSRFADDLIYLEEKGHGCAEFHDVNAGGQDYLDRLREAGIPYEGYNTDGIEYPESLWAYIGDEEDSSQICVNSYDGTPFAQIFRNMKPDRRTMDEISEYYRILDKVKDYMKANKHELPKM